MVLGANNTNRVEDVTDPDVARCGWTNHYWTVYRGLACCKLTEFDTRLRATLLNR